MTSVTPFARRALGAAACALTLAAPSAAWAGPLSAFFFDGEGNVLVFDAAAGSGGWNGSLTGFADPAMPMTPPLSLAALVLFQFDAAANLLSGQFEFSDASDLSSAIFGSVSGSFTDPDSSLDLGGQLALDYMITGGSGQFAGAQGFGLSFLSFDPNAMVFDNYGEQGLLVAEIAAVPEPGTLLLLAVAGLGWLVAGRRVGAAAGGTTAA